MVYQAISLLFNLFLHPLASFPGPFTHRASKLPWFVAHMTGTLPFHVQSLHERYGPVVRIAPHHLSFTDARAFRDIYGKRVVGVGDAPSHSEMRKATTFYRSNPRLPHSIITAPAEAHRDWRRSLAPGFSDRAIKAQEPVIRRYVDLLVQRLREKCGEGRAAAAATSVQASDDAEGAEGSTVVNILDYYNWTTFDLIGDLVFGEPFGCLEKSRRHFWVDTILKSLQDGTVMVGLTYLGFAKLVRAMVDLAMFKHGPLLREWTKTKVQARIDLQGGRQDLFEGMLERRRELVSFRKRENKGGTRVMGRRKPLPQKNKPPRAHGG